MRTAHAAVYSTDRHSETFIPCIAFTSMPAAATTIVLCMLGSGMLAVLVPCTAHAETNYPELGIRVEVVADNLEVPWSIDWLPDGTLIFTERGGDLHIIRDDTGPAAELLLSVDVNGGAEGGLLGLAVDPDFKKNGYVYLYYTYNDIIWTANKVVRYQYVDSMLAGEPTTILDGIPGSAYHDGGRIAFGPDGMLYVATGDAINPDLSQDPESLAGKILRMDRDGEVPPDNPSDSLVYSTGHRNPQGMDWNNQGILIITEHGPSGWMGTGHDEINLIVPGGNYGWPLVIGDGAEDDGYMSPILHTGGSTWAPSGSEFYDGRMIPEWEGRYFVAALFGRSLQMLEFDSEYGVKSHTELFSDQFGRLRDVQTGPDGHLYVLTSNRDGRGQPSHDDDKILRIVPLYDSIAKGGEKNLQLQSLEVFEYVGDDGTESLKAALRHPGYVVSPIQFDIEEKRLGFEFEKTDDGDAGSLSLHIQRPLLSPPFAITHQDSTGRLTVHDADVTYENDYYILRFYPDATSGRIDITGTYVIPEYGSVTVAVLATTVAAVLIAAMMARVTLSGRLSPALIRT